MYFLFCKMTCILGILLPCSPLTLSTTLFPKYAFLQALWFEALNENTSEIQQGAESQRSSEQTSVWFIKLQALTCCSAAEEVFSSRTPLPSFRGIVIFQSTHYSVFNIHILFTVFIYYFYSQKATASCSLSCPKSNVSATTREKVRR